MLEVVGTDSLDFSGCNRFPAVGARGMIPIRVQTSAAIRRSDCERTANGCRDWNLEGLPALSSEPLILVHVSDIHFSERHDDGPLDTDRDLRHQIERDLKLELVPHVGEATAILVTGDVAYSGKHEEYETARDWLKQLCGVVGCAWPNVWTVPGNHDVDQDTVRGSPVLQDLHTATRAARAEDISGKLVDYLRDTACRETLFLPVTEYNLFAAPLGCSVSADKPYWDTELPLNEGYKLRVRGLTSTLISGLCDNDPPRQQALGEFQAILREEDHVAHLAMCHHPPSWLLDQREIDTALKARAQIHLFGHEHDQAIEEIDRRCVRVYAGAVQPSRKESGWEPRYNVLAVGVTVNGNGPCLEVTVYPRVWNRQSRRFQGDFDAGGSDHRTFRLPLGRQSSPSFRQAPLNPVDQTEGDVQDAVRALPQATDVESNVDPMRHLRYRFLTLPFGIQIQIAQALELFRDEDRGIKDPELFRRVSQRALQEDKLSQLWDAVEARHTDGPAAPSPFGEDTQRSP